MPERDPLIVSNFALEIQGVVKAFFKQASGFDNSSEIVTHKMVDAKGRQVVQKIPGELNWGDITLQRGITDDLSLWKWRQQIIDGRINEARKDGSIVLYNQEMTEVARFNFHNGWPSAWKGPDVNAEDNSVGIEEITIAHEGLERVL